MHEQVESEAEATVIGVEADGSLTVDTEGEVIEMIVEVSGCELTKDEVAKIAKLRSDLYRNRLRSLVFMVFLHFI